MKLKIGILATVMAFGISHASAGTFVSLTNGNGTNVSPALGGVVIGNGNPATDPAYIETLSATYLPGFDDTTPWLFGFGGSGDVIASTINYRTYAAFDSANTLSTGTLNLVDYKITRGVDLSVPGAGQADIFDFVYRDSADNKLVFGTRYLNREDNDEEANFLYRTGLSGYDTSVAWTYSTDSDLYMYSAAKTTVSSGGSEFPLDSGVVRMQGDFSVSEGLPWSALFLVKTNAENYTLAANAVGFSQSGEESQLPFRGAIEGFVPITAVPEPESFALLVMGLGVISAFVRRQKKQA